MQHLRELLTTENSELARLLRFSLHGLEAALMQAHQEYPLDPGGQVCAQVLQELQDLLHPASATATEITVREPCKLIDLQAAFNADSELNFYLGNTPLNSQSDGELWQEIHRKLLRVPENLATIWRQRALESAQAVGAIADDENVEELPFIRDEIIYPGLTGTIQAQGLSLSQQAFVNAGFTQENQSENLNLLAGFILLYTKFVKKEPDLHHALKTVFSFDAISLHNNIEQHQQYLEALQDRWHRTQKSEENSDEIANLHAWIDMDEAIHSLVFMPPAERYSWWGNLQQESRRILKKVADAVTKAGHEVRIKQLSGLYADVCQFSKDDLQVDCGGTPGEVLTCLRIYARINQEEYPGRVMFRGSR
ncbi:hypothetical protein B6N60_01702 [Richelia sinica FACHB-800]|uniref:Uncharacterized protein n=1 Tax=Richelia sinica FACHB-800 TaxID=1357546 RepID=A0A975T6G8_9NOST|nr:hypothetical protein [Richelia sinica]MBD2667458.1 hypothetical protein [Richelia sinica FACHB-800]QXE23014.1 hypothetical protein B6N60_01702 [Richelia sinica FACHB-800]